MKKVVDQICQEIDSILSEESGRFECQGELVYVCCDKEGKGRSLHFWITNEESKKILGASDLLQIASFILEDNSREGYGWVDLDDSLWDVKIKVTGHADDDQMGIRLQCIDWLR